MTLDNQTNTTTYVVKYMNAMGRACKCQRHAILWRPTGTPISNTLFSGLSFPIFSGISRAMLHLSGAKYTNEFVTAEQVADDRTAFPFGKVPVLIVNHPDGTSLELGESIAIEVGPINQALQRRA